MICVASDVPAAEPPFEIQVFDDQSEVMQPYRFTSGKHYRLQAISPDKGVLAAQWFLTGNLGSITAGNQPTLAAVFVGEGNLICRVNGVEQRVSLSVVPAVKTIDSSGGKLQSPAGLEITLPEGSIAIERKIGIEIIAPPGLPPAAQRFIRVVQISPALLVLKRPAQLIFFFPSDNFAATKPQLYFWETFGKKWIPLHGNVNISQGSLTVPINATGIYALMAPVSTDFKRSDRLQIQKVELSPRVFFAPDIHRLTIAYLLNARDITQAFVTMDIFDLRGRRVRRLLEDAPHYIGPNIAQWDGLTDDGVLVRNGRYFLVIQARIGSQHAVHRKLIVVFK